MHSRRAGCSTIWNLLDKHRVGKEAYCNVRQCCWSWQVLSHQHRKILKLMNFLIATLIGWQNVANPGCDSKQTIQDTLHETTMNAGRQQTYQSSHKLASFIFWSLFQKPSVLVQYFYKHGHKKVQHNRYFQKPLTQVKTIMPFLLPLFWVCLNKFMIKSWAISTFLHAV